MLQNPAAKIVSILPFMNFQSRQETDLFKTTPAVPADSQAANILSAQWIFFFNKKQKTYSVSVADGAKK